MLVVLLVLVILRQTGGDDIDYSTAVMAALW